MYLNTLSKNQIKLFSSLKYKKYRHSERKILIEGYLPTIEAIRSKWIISEILYTPDIKNKAGFDEIYNHPAAQYEIESSVLKKISTESTPQGIVAIADKMSYSANDMTGNLIYADSIQDPGNLGTLIRIAHWFGLGGVVMNNDCVDISNPKTVRSSKGSLFHVPHCHIESPQKLKETFPHHQFIVSEVNKGESVSTFTPSQTPFILVMGNESHGVSPDWQNYHPQYLTLPRLGGAESLNVAVAASAILSKMLY